MRKLYKVFVDVANDRNPFRVYEFTILKETPKTFLAETEFNERRFQKEKENVVQAKDEFNTHFTFYTTDETKIDDLVAQGIESADGRCHRTIKQQQDAVTRLGAFKHAYEEHGKGLATWTR